MRVKYKRANGTKSESESEIKFATKESGPFRSQYDNIQQPASKYSRDLKTNTFTYNRILSYMKLGIH